METYKVLLSLLFENQRYEEVLKLYEEIRYHLELKEMMADRSLNCIVLGACYKLVNLFNMSLHKIPLIKLCTVSRILQNTLNMHKIFGIIYNI